MTSKTIELAETLKTKGYYSPYFKTGMLLLREMTIRTMLWNEKLDVKQRYRRVSPEENVIQALINQGVVQKKETYEEFMEASRKIWSWELGYFTKTTSFTASYLPLAIYLQMLWEVSAEEIKSSEYKDLPNRRFKSQMRISRC